MLTARREGGCECESVCEEVSVNYLRYVRQEVSLVFEIIHCL